MILILALSHRGKYYLHLSLAFGYHSGSYFFQKRSDAVRFIMNKYGYDAVLNYIDVFFVCLFFVF